MQTQQRRRFDDKKSVIATVERIAAVPTILDVVCRTTGMGFAAVAHVAEDRWIACSVKDEIAFGLKPGGELKVETTICHEIRQNPQAVIIDHVAEDPLYKNHHTPAMYGLQSYISMPIILADGKFFGTLCAIDPRPARLNTPETVGMFKLFAELIAFHIDALEKLDSSESTLSEERESGDLREQFIAVLGHDLRNPLGAISSGAAILARMPQEPRAKDIVDMIQGCVTRMTGLIENVLDFARGRMGKGIVLEYRTDSLTDVLTQVVGEIRATYPERAVELHCDLTQPVECDTRRIAQLLSNLLGNAMVYGKSTEPVRIEAKTMENEFCLAVTNAGRPIPPETLGRLFEPFIRGEGESREGLGLGLYIVSEIARAHLGSIEATSTEQETRFTFRMPIARQAHQQAA